MSIQKISVKRINPFAFRAEINKLQKKFFDKDVPLIPIEEGWWWGAFDQTKLVAFACMRPSSSYAGSTYMSRAGVLKEYRGRGLQRKLINARVNFAKKGGYNFVVTDTFKNPESANNLITCGFKTMLPTRLPFIPAEGMTIWYKDLKNNRTRTKLVPKVLT